MPLGTDSIYLRLFQKMVKADIAILVVSAKENQFDAVFNKGQLKEHVLLCKGLAIDNTIVAVNKMDLVG